MHRLSRVLMVVAGLVMLVSITGCDVTQQVLDTLGLAGQIAGIWLQ